MSLFWFVPTFSLWTESVFNANLILAVYEISDRLQSSVSNATHHKHRVDVGETNNILQFVFPVRLPLTWPLNDRAYWTNDTLGEEPSMSGIFKKIKINARAIDIRSWWHAVPSEPRVRHEKFRTDTKKPSKLGRLR